MSAPPAAAAAAAAPAAVAAAASSNTSSSTIIAAGTAAKGSSTLSGKANAKAAATATAPAAAALPVKRVLIAVANGSEDIETVCLIDILRRGGVQVTVASVESTRQVVCARHTTIVADALLDDALKAAANGGAPYDGIFLPGGMPGAERLRDSATLIAALKEQKRAGRWYGAICASPAVVLTTHGLLHRDDGLVGTAYPTFQRQLAAAGVLAPPAAATAATSSKATTAASGGAHTPSSSPSTPAVTERVVVSHNCVTSVGPGTSIEFALKLVELLYDSPAHAQRVADPLIAYLPPPPPAAKL